MINVVSYKLHKIASIPAGINEQFLNRVYQNPKNKQILDLLKKTGDQYGVAVRVSGGFVRDHLLGHFTNDIDVSVQGMTGKDFGDRMREFDPVNVTPTKLSPEKAEQSKKLAVGFMTVFGEPLEIVNARKEEYDLIPCKACSGAGCEYCEQTGKTKSRNPTIKPGTPEEDAFRRDLTINALSFNVNEKKLEDFTNGYQDLIRSDGKIILRTPLNPLSTFDQDPVRLLRVFRFYSRYSEAEIDPELMLIMRNEKLMADIHKEIYRRMQDPNDPNGIVQERTSKEFRKMMQGKRPEVAIGLMFETGILHDIFGLPPEFHPLNMDQNSRYHQLNIIEHTMQVIKHSNNLAKEYGLDDNLRLSMNLAALFHDVGKLDPKAQKIKPDGNIGYYGNPEYGKDALPHEHSSANQWNRFADALNLGKKREEGYIRSTVLSLVKEHMKPHSFSKMKKTKLHPKLREFKYYNKEEIAQILLGIADARSKNIEYDPNVDKPYLEHMEFLNNFQMPPELLSGGEIIALFPELSPQPPPGQEGFIETIKREALKSQFQNPDIDKQTFISSIVKRVRNGQVLKDYPRQNNLPPVSSSHQAELKKFYV